MADGYLDIHVGRVPCLSVNSVRDSGELAPPLDPEHWHDKVDCRT